MASVWRAIGRSVAGASHHRAKLPNQDALRLWNPHGDGQSVIAAVADGHGSATHFRSETGSRFAVEVAEAVLRDLDAALRDGAVLDAETEQWIREEIVSRWRAKCIADAEANPFSSAEEVRLMGAGARDQIFDRALAYGSTLLAGLATEGLLVLLQIGDGDILAVDSAGTQFRPFPRDARHVANLTTSLCLPNAVDDVRVTSLQPGDIAGGSREPVLLIFATDGYANSFASSAAFERVVGPQILSQVRERGLAWVAQVLPRSLKKAAERGAADDVTMAILTCEDAPAGAIAPGQGRGDAPVTLGGLLVSVGVVVLVALGLWLWYARYG
ncbi:MAG TPA: PP2C family serine/threonine-protein phosphatase [Gemmatimonadaceae bacterium]|nr:PP2C family serine/threonine-protein phosphatase [Gemmatimonadaceae bacterium]